VVHSGPFWDCGTVSRIVNQGLSRVYSGPVFCTLVTVPDMWANYKGKVEDRDVSELDSDGATAISLCAPTNPTANLGVTLAETYREGIPSLPGIQSWEHRARDLRDVGSEYLNVQFGWAPLVSEVHNVVNAARHHRDIMKNYAHNEGRNIHRRFDFSTETEREEVEISSGDPIAGVLSKEWLHADSTPPVRTVSLTRERKRWFEGCFTYGGPGITDNFTRHLGFGEEADAVYGLSLTPDVLWNVAPWSWAVDWFTNAGDVIHNVSNFATAGLVLRYGYMMEESIETYSMNWANGRFLTFGNKPGFTRRIFAGSGSRGFRTVSKTRAPANPFGFGVGWEGLSPTQLAITAAIGITRLL